MHWTVPPFPMDRSLALKNFVENSPSQIGYITMHTFHDTCTQDEARCICDHYDHLMRAHMGLSPQDRLHERYYLARRVTISTENHKRPETALRRLIQLTISELGLHFGLVLDNGGNCDTIESLLRHFDDTVLLLTQVHKSKIEDKNFPRFIFMIAQIESALMAGYSRVESFVRALETLFDAIPTGRLVFIVYGWFNTDKLFSEAVQIYEAYDPMTALYEPEVTGVGGEQEWQFI